MHFLAEFTMKNRTRLILVPLRRAVLSLRALRGEESPGNTERRTL